MSSGGDREMPLQERWLDALVSATIETAHQDEN